MKELITTEQDYYNRLTDDERCIYTADHKQLSAIDTWNDFYIRQFVEVSRQLNELHRIHQQYNEITEYIDDRSNLTKSQQETYSDLCEINEELFKMSISIGNFSTVFRLSCMDECDALYVYLASVKKNRFDWLCDNFNISVLIETLVSHDCYK